MSRTSLSATSESTATTRSAISRAKKLPLTRTEFDILLFFLTHRNRIYSREEIIHNVWGDEVVVTERTIDTNITRLRKKLGGYDKYIVTRQGFGYGFKEKISYQWRMFLPLVLTLWVVIIGMGFLQFHNEAQLREEKYANSSTLSTLA